MAFKKGDKKPENSGRKKDTPNKITACMREAFLEAFNMRGGVQALLIWAAKSDENETDFYRLTSKLISVNVKAEIKDTTGVTAWLDEQLNKIDKNKK